MKYAIRLILLTLIFAVNFCDNTIAQCTYYQVVHLAGTEQVGCTMVTVNAEGSATDAYFPYCNFGPYFIGFQSLDGSYFFNFSPPISGISVDAQTIDNNLLGVEELFFEVNGSFYPITNPGTNNSCDPPAAIFPPGVVRGAGLSNWGSWQDIRIDETISTLRVGNNIVFGLPLGFTFALRICCAPCSNSNAGQLTSNALNLCPNELATVPPAEQYILEGGDILQYVLFTNPADIPGSVIATSNTPQFAFDPATMTEGLTYHLAAIAGEEVGGNVLLISPCLSVSNAIDVTWWPSPTVELAANENCIKPGNCFDVFVNFTGAPPFQLSGQVKAGNNVVTTFSDTYSTNNAMFNICLPLNTPLGTVVVEATNLTDAHCTCD